MQRTSTRALSAFVLLVLTACSGTSPRAEVQSAPPAVQAPAASDTSVELTRIAVRTLLIAWSGAEGAPEDVTRTREQARSRADLLLSMAHETGADFSGIAQEYSDPSPTEGPMSRVVERGQLDEPLESLSFGLELNEVGGPVETAAGWLLMQRVEAPESGPAEIGARHILVMHEDSQRAPEDVERSREEALELAQEAHARASEADADWAGLVAEYSDEPGAAEREGDLGTFGRGRMVPVFERAAFALDVGELSEVVESPFGFHIIRRTR